MKLKVIDTTDNKHLGREVEVSDLSELSDIFEEGFVYTKEEGDIITMSSSNYTVKFRKLD